MKKKFIISLCGTAIILISTITSSMFAIEGNAYAPGRAVIKVTETFNQITTRADGIIETEKEWFNQLANQYGIYTLKKVYNSNREIFRYLYIIEFPEDFAVLDVCEDFNEKDEIVSVFPDFKAEICAIPDDEYYDYQWPLPRVQAEEAWDVAITNPDTIVIGITDTGVDVALPSLPTIFDPHPDLEDNLYMVNGTLFGNNLINPDRLPLDDCGHGTHVAGIVAATTNNNELGIASLAGWEDYNIKIMPVKIFDAGGSGDYTTCIEGVRWAADPDDDPDTDDGCDIINMSWASFCWDIYGGGPAPIEDYDEMIEEYENVLAYVADTCNCLCIAAATNAHPLIGFQDMTGYPVYPACSEHVLAVAATNRYDNKSNYSNYADWVDVSAPGGEKYFAHDENAFLSSMPKHYDYSYYDPSGFGSWIDHNYDFMVGTSMASPFVASLAGMVKAKYPEDSNEEIRGRILGTADDIYPDNMKYLGKLGAGRINAYKSLTDSVHPTLRCQEIVIDDDSNGIFECGETTEFEIKLKNWWIDAQNVMGTLYTDDPAITIINNELYWGDISQDSVASHTPLPEITDSSIEPRLVTLQLELEADNMESKILHIPLEVFINANTPLVSLPLSENEAITTEAVISDIDNDGLDEIIVGSSAGKVYIYNHPDTISLVTGSLIDCTPAISDINNDGYDEIVVGNDDGNVIVYDNDGNQISEYQVDGMCKHAIILEDVTGDGQLEIIVTTWISPISYIYVINPITGEQNSCSIENYPLFPPLSVADVNQDGRKELLFTKKVVPAPCELKVFSVNASLEIEEIWSVNCGETNSIPLSGPIIGDIDEDGEPEILISYKESGFNCIEAWHFADELPFWSNDTITCNGIPIKQIMIGNTVEDDYGLEIIVPNVSSIVTLNSNGEVINQTIEQVNEEIEPIVISDINSDGFQEVLGINLNLFFITDHNGNELPQWRVSTTSSNLFLGLSMGRVTEEYDNHIVLITQDGTIFAFPVEFPPTSISEWPQYQNNARNTGCYFQPLPEEIAHDITVKHNAVIDKEVRFSTMDIDASLIFEPGIEILFKPSGSILGRNVVAVGAENNMIKFAGLCADTIKSYWEGISMEGKGKCHFKYCELKNANVSIFLEDIEHQTIENCIIENDSIGILLYHSSPIIKENIITNNDYGIVGYHKSMPILSALDSPECPFRNAIVNNNVRDIFLDSSIPYLNNGFNDIYNTFGGCYIELENYPDRFLKARRNYWGTTDIEEIYTHLDPAYIFIIEPICEEPNTSYNPFSDPKYELLKEAYSFLGNEDYVNAEISFKNLIETYPETQEADQSISGLFICYKESEGNWNEFETYINNLLNQPSISETSQKLWFSYLNLCKREKEEYNEAIAGYESILSNNPTYEDSCYAVIDIGNTYLEAENGGKSISCKYPELIPISAELHQHKTRELLTSILTGKHIHSPASDINKLILSQNYPNPYRFHTTISYAIPKSGIVSLKIYNIKGQLVKTLVNEHKGKGYYTETFDYKDNKGTKLANGIYFYKLENRNKSIVKKMILLR